MGTLEFASPPVGVSEPNALSAGGSGRGLHRIAILTAVAAFPLIWMGGLVTSHKAGMAVLDWPNSNGYNMFLFPVAGWVGGVFYEHTHRLLGTVVGFLAVLLALNAWGPGRRPAVGRWLLGSGIAGIMLAAMLAGLSLGAARGEKLPESATATMISHLAVGLGGLAIVLLAAAWARHKDPRPWVRWLCLAALTAIIIQGVLGGLRVVLINLNLAVVHGVFAQAVFAGLVGIAVVTGRHLPISPSPTLPLSRSSSLTRWATVAVAVVFIQLILGALMRHYDAGLAIPGLPLAFGRMIPPTSQQELTSLGSHATLAQVWLHFGHRIGAIVVAAVLIGLIVQVVRRDAGGPMTSAAVLLGGLLALQVTLGVLTVLLRKPADLATAHVATGALILATCTVVLIGARPRQRKIA